MSWREFVVAMHLVRRLRAGQPLPHGVPMDLRNLVSSLAPAEASVVTWGQRERASAEQWPEGAVTKHSMAKRRPSYIRVAPEWRVSDAPVAP